MDLSRAALRFRRVSWGRRSLWTPHTEILDCRYWLRKIAVRVGYRYWKGHTKAQIESVSLSAHEIEVPQSLATGVEDAAEARDFLEEILKLVSPRDRLVLTLLYWDGCSVAEAAELAGWTQAMVKVQAYRARKRLKKLVEELEL